MRGVQLSGGQKQRIAVARALIRKQQMLLLDEATSYLDGATENKFQEKIDKNMQGKTSMVIAHRIATIRNAGCINVFDGEILEQGSYKELMERKKHFYNLERGAKLTG